MDEMKREIQRRGAERVMELGRAVLAVVEGDEGPEEVGMLVAVWAGGGRDEVGVEVFVAALRSLEDFAELVDRLGRLGLDGGE